MPLHNKRGPRVQSSVLKQGSGVTYHLQFLSNANSKSEKDQLWTESGFSESFGFETAGADNSMQIKMEPDLLDDDTASCSDSHRDEDIVRGALSEYLQQTHKGEEMANSKVDACKDVDYVDMPDSDNSNQETLLLRSPLSHGTDC